jgi:hypothetical protein
MRISLGKLHEYALPCHGLESLVVAIGNNGTIGRAATAPASHILAVAGTVDLRVQNTTVSRGQTAKGAATKHEIKSGETACRRGRAAVGSDIIQVVRVSFSHLDLLDYHVLAVRLEH